MKLADVAKLLCDPNTTKSTYLKAIELFEFQVSIFAPNSVAIQTDGRVLVALRILEHIQKSFPDVSDVTKLTELLKLPGYAEIADVVFQSGGWRCIRQLWSASEFDEQLAIRQQEAKIAARLADFSYRFAKSIPNDSRKGGSTMARACLNAVNAKNKGYSTGTLMNRWQEYGSAAALQYVLLIQKIGPKPLKLNKVGFVERLISQASDVDGLRRFFAAYRDVSHVLRPRGYECPLVDLDCLKSIKPQLPIKEFSEEMRKEILKGSSKL
jgi:hypothetical protein